MKEKNSRRRFLTDAGLASISLVGTEQPSLGSRAPLSDRSDSKLGPLGSDALFPRIFTGKYLHMLAFPLGGVGAGSVSLGGRGNLRDWEIFNKPDKGNQLSYAFPSVWIQLADQQPIARVLEARYEPPYEGQEGLGSRNAPGLSRLAGAKFTGAYPLARIDFEEPALPVRISLDAFSPFIPHEPDDSGLPVAILRYTVQNPSQSSAQVSIAWSVENPAASATQLGPNQPRNAANELRSERDFTGLFMTNPGLGREDPMYGSFVLAVRNAEGGKLTYLRGWPKGRWWNSPLLFWDDFTRDGELGPEAAEMGPVGALCLKRRIEPRISATYEFLLAWHFPNRTPARCGWTAPKGKENTVVGNWYCTRFQNAWDAAQYASARLPELEKKTRLFADCLRESTLPPPILEAASANLSTLATTTCFRTADGAFHGFEGVDDKHGCCFGNCTHVWNYETTTPHLFPSFARSLREAAFGFSMDDAGAIHFRQLLPDGIARSGFAAADGQMGQIVHAYLDWRLSGDREWLQRMWPRIRKALSFAWVPGGWDADRDGVMEGVQHNTYDVEFYGPNPQCGIYYLSALRASEEMAREVGDAEFAAECRRLFASGSAWIDQHLFNGNYYVQQVRSLRNDQIAPALRSDMGASDPQHPSYQVGEGCLVDQLMGQYLAEVCGLGPLVSSKNIGRTLHSIYERNYKRTLYTHDTVQRTFALNDESALVICDYPDGSRPEIPFPYFAEVMTGFEYAAATHMLFAGMVNQGIECVTNIRKRYDGERRNPWDEAECGHHYARAMAAWSGILALSGFRYHAGQQSLEVMPRLTPPDFRCIWFTGNGWGTFNCSQSSTRAAIHLSIHSGTIALKQCSFRAPAGSSNVQLNGTLIQHKAQHNGGTVQLQMERQLTAQRGDKISLTVSA